jgi:transcription antitermination factor NusG
MWVNGRSFMQAQIEFEQAVTGQATRWFAVHTRYQHEHLVAAALARKGMEVFLPTYDTIRRWSDRKKRVTLPLFPGYLFFANDIERWIHIVSTPGVNAIVKVGNIHAEIPNGEIVAIRRMLEGSLRVEPHPFLADGDRVRIMAGPLTGLEGIVLRKKDTLRLILSIEILGQSAAVEIEGCDVQCLSQSPRLAGQSLC